MGTQRVLKGVGPRLLGPWLVLLALTAAAPPAEAGIFDFLFGGRESGGRPSGRDRGGAVRSGRIVGGTDANVPYVLTPRNTFHIDDRFDIRWHPVAGASRYTVRLWRWDDAYGVRDWLMWEAETTDTQIAYEGAVALDPARFYSVEVITDTGVSSNLDAGCATAGFALLFPENAQRLVAELARYPLPQGAATPEATETALLDRANVYLRHSMVDYAIDLLAADPATAQRPALALALAELYSYAGLNQASITQYQQALALAEAQQDGLQQAVALEGLGFVYSTLLDLDAALPLLYRARGLYRASGYDITADLLSQRIESLETFQSGSYPTDDARLVCQYASPVASVFSGNADAR